MRIRWTVGSRADLLEMFEYISEENPEAAKRVRSRIYEATRNLRDFPEIGRMVPEPANPAIRELIVRPYRVVYLVLEEEIHILGVVHSRRLLPEFDVEAEK